MTEKEKTNKEQVVSKKKLIAKKNHKINCPPHLVLEIKKGDDLSDISKIFTEHLKNNEVL